MEKGKKGAPLSARAIETFLRLSREPHLRLEGVVTEGAMARVTVSLVDSLVKDAGEVPVECGVRSLQSAALEARETAPADKMPTERDIIFD